MLNNTTLIGRLTHDIELEYVGKENTPRVNTTIAVQRTKESADFIPLTFLGKTAENIAQFGHKGMLLGITGAVQRDTWVNDDGATKSKIYVMVNRCVFLSKKNEATQEAKSEDTALNINEEDLPF